jgi:hypothetical protein
VKPAGYVVTDSLGRRQLFLDESRADNAVTQQRGCIKQPLYTPAQIAIVLGARDGDASYIEGKFA